jgi:hypothetical protein
MSKANGTKIYILVDKEDGEVLVVRRNEALINRIADVFRPATNVKVIEKFLPSPQEESKELFDLQVEEGLDGCF